MRVAGQIDKVAFSHTLPLKWQRPRRSLGRSVDVYTYEFSDPDSIASQTKELMTAPRVEKAAKPMVEAMRVAVILSE